MKRILLAILFYTFIAGPILSQDVIEMKKEESGVYSIPCEVNGLKLRFIFDTGASAVSISLTEASFMLKNGYLDDSDITGTTNVQTADGKIAENYVINLNELKIGSVTLNNVRAIVSTGLDAPLLLGQSVLDNLGHWSVKESNLILNERESLKNPTFANIHDLKQYCEQLKSEGRGKKQLMPLFLIKMEKILKEPVYSFILGKKDILIRIILTNASIYSEITVLKPYHKNMTPYRNWRGFIFIGWKIFQMAQNYMKPWPETINMTKAIGGTHTTVCILQILRRIIPKPRAMLKRPLKMGCINSHTGIVGILLKKENILKHINY